jgi:hypothetical protein
MMCKHRGVGEHPVVTGEAWRAFCDRMAVLGERILEDDFPDGDHARAEGVRHLASQVACWLTYALGSTDPTHPTFFRSSDPVYRWGGPNVDQVARRALISGDGVYRISGEMGSCEEFVLQVKSGTVQTGGADVDQEFSASSLGIQPGERFEIHLGGESRGDRWIKLDRVATFVHIRDFYFDWQPRQPATFVIERLDTQGLPAASVTPDSVATLLDDAAGQIEHSIVFWNDYQRRMRQGQELNTFSPPAGAARGVQDIIYSHAFVALGADDAMVVALDGRDAALWDIQLYNRAWYEPLDFANRVTSLNHRQVRSNPDGSVDVVIAGSDPGVANWLDTEGRGEVLATVRWLRPESPPSVRSLVTDRGSLPGDLEIVDAGARREEIKRRTAHVGWRFRT